MTVAKRWSYSRIANYLKCPLMAKGRLEGWDEPKSPALARGNAIHEQAENYVLGTSKWRDLLVAVTGSTSRVTPQMRAHSMRNFKPEFDRLRKAAGVIVEQEMGVTRHFRARTGWSERNTWLRAKLDVIVPSADVIDGIDYKTGNEYPKEHRQQAEVYALTAFVYWPDVPRVKMEFWYLDHGSIGVYPFEREKKFAELRDKWNDIADDYTHERKWEPTPSEASCRFCPFHPKKGGPCEVGV